MIALNEKLGPMLIPLQRLRPAEIDPEVIRDFAPALVSLRQFLYQLFGDA